jgi:hypothetical protein
MTRSLSWTFTSFSVPCHVWFTPNASTTSSRVLETLHTFAYELRRELSSQLTRAVAPASGADSGASYAFSLFSATPISSAWPPPRKDGRPAVGSQRARFSQRIRTLPTMTRAVMSQLE